MALRIPKEHTEAINALVRLPEDEFAKLQELLNQEAPSAEPNRVAQRVEDSFKKADIPSPSNLVSAIYSMIRSVRQSKLTQAEFVAGILDQVVKAAPMTPEEREAGERRVAGLIHAGTPLFRSVKAHDLLTSHQSVYQGARVLTDIRPIFPEDMGVPFSEVVTTHTLRVAYYENGDEKELYIALDSFDLQDLKEVIERAENKNKLVQERLTGLNLQVFEAER